MVCARIWYAYLDLYYALQNWQICIRDTDKYMLMFMKRKHSFRTCPESHYLHRLYYDLIRYDLHIWLMKLKCEYFEWWLHFMDSCCIFPGRNGLNVYNVERRNTQFLWRHALRDALYDMCYGMWTLNVHENYAAMCILYFVHCTHISLAYKHMLMHAEHTVHVERACHSARHALHSVMIMYYITRFTGAVTRRKCHRRDKLWENASAIKNAGRFILFKHLYVHVYVCHHIRNYAYFTRELTLTN